MAIADIYDMSVAFAAIIGASVGMIIGVLMRRD